MTNITPPDWVLCEAAKRSELSNDTPRQRAILFDTNPSFRALCRAIEQHEAFKQEVSDAIKDACKFAKEGPDRLTEYMALRFAFLITPKPKPDPLAVALAESDDFFDPDWDYAPYAAKLRTALEARGLEIREKGQ